MQSGFVQCKYLNGKGFVKYLSKQCKSFWKTELGSKNKTEITLEWSNRKASWNKRGRGGVGKRGEGGGGFLKI